MTGMYELEGECSNVCSVKRLLLRGAEENSKDRRNCLIVVKI